MDLWVRILLVILVAFGGAFIQRVTGFGFGIFAIMFLPYLVSSYGSATLLANLLSVTMSVFIAIKMRKNIQWKLIIPCMIAGYITTFLAVEFMKGQSNAILKAILGGFLIVLSVYFIFVSNRVKIKATLFSGVMLGGLSGALGGLFSTGGPPMVIYLLSATSSVAAYMATMQCHFAIMNMYTIGVKIAAGLLNTEVLILALFGYIGVFLGTFLGAKVADRLDGAKFKKTVYGFMAISGVITLVTALLEL